MADLMDLLPAGNVLRELVLRERAFQDGTLSQDIAGMASAAGIDPGCVAQSGTNLFKYSGPVFNLVFESDLQAGHKHYWRAEMIVSDFAMQEKVSLEDGDKIPIVVTDSSQNPVEEGIFRFLGLELHVVEGKTSCTLLQLQDSLLEKKAISLTTESAGTVLGHLSLC